MSVSSGNNRSGLSSLTLVVAGAALLIAGPGWAYFYFVKNFSIVEASVFGVLVGIFSFYSLSGVSVIFGLIRRSRRKAQGEGRRPQ